MLDPRKRLTDSGLDSDREREELLSGMRRPEDTYKDLKDELTRSYHESALAVNHQMKVAWLKRFIHQACALLASKKPEEKEYVDSVRKFMREEVEGLSLQTKPIIDDKMPIYEINHNIKGGGSVRCHLQDFERVLRRLEERKAEDTYDTILPIATELAFKLQKHEVLEFERDYYESVSLDGEWAMKKMPFPGFDGNEDEEEGS